MVQRKVADKFGIQADHLSHDHISLKKPSSAQHQDGKNRLPDLKKKMMKKSRSFKLSDIGHQSLKSSTSSALRKNNISQPGKPPPTLDVSTILLTPKKQTPTITKTVESSPNYMKSTSCFDARKEPQSSQVSLRRNSTNSQVVSSSSNNKRLAKNSTKTSSSKLVRALIKTPSFKPSRLASSKKSPRVALCTSDDHVQRATCSSTLKDSKFPSYLMLNHGGTESEGTSVMKVCPYTYCSLNGHHHASLPPLKRFLSARRRSLKNQKSFKLAVPFDKAAKEIDEEDDDEKVGMDFFVEIYANKTKEDDKEKTEFLSSKGGDEEEAENYLQVKVVDSLSVGSPQSEIDTDESPERYSEVVWTETGIIENFHEEANNYYVPVSDEEETEGSDSDMEWEKATFSDVEIEDEADNSRKMDDESEPILGFSPDDITEDDEKEAHKEESACFEGDFAEELNLKIEVSGQVPDGLMFDQLSSTEDGFEDLSGNEENLRLDEETESMHASMDATSEEEQVEERIQESEERNMVSEVENVINLTGVIDEDSSNNPQDDETSSQVCDASEDGKQNKEESLETDKQVNNDDFSFEYCDDANVIEEIPSPDPSQATSEANQVVTKVEEGSANIEILDHNEKTHMTICDDSVDHSDVKLNESEKAADSKGEIEVTEVEIRTKPEKKPELLRVEHTSDDEELRNKWNRSRRGIKDLEEESTRDFNPREPNYLPLVAEPEGEKVDLKHQMMDERKNSEEWMIDYALQQTVTKLAPAKKKKVALLVEAFEAVTPVTKCESRRLSHHQHHHHSQAFPQAIRPIQACS
ncbi:hypothetical protein L484_027877 [Morus notabilis]|uniref:Calmodulin-binding domain-containing protein n=1 Tax=Morus notabilis TaxID=981085 RepID=W9SVW6_9ROSA|nr:calmodulin binding protein PICBP [Morus notabilis]EXC30702.1 hypothetical protein L484_027877 [Morus notabilis]